MPVEQPTALLGPEMSNERFGLYAAHLGHLILRRTSELKDALNTIETHYSSTEHPAGIVLFVDPRQGLGLSVVDTTPGGQSIADTKPLAERFVHTSPKGRIHDVRSGMNGWTYQAYMRQVGSVATMGTYAQPTLLSGEPMSGDKNYVGFLEQGMPRIAALELAADTDRAQLCIRPAINIMLA